MPKLQLSGGRHWNLMGRLRRGGLRTRLVSTILLVAAPFMVLLILVLGSMSASVLRSTAENELAQSTTSAAESINQWDRYFVMTLQNLRGQPDIIEMNPDEQQPVIHQMKRVYNRLDIVRVTRPDGISIVRTDGDTPVSYADREWFKAVMSGAPIYRQVLVTRTGGKPAVNFSTPIRNAKGEVVGVLSAVTALASMPDILHMADVKDSYQTFLVDGGGRALAHPDVAAASDLVDLSALPSVAWALKNPPGNWQFTDAAGKRWYMHSQRLESGWMVISQVQEQVVMAKGAGILRVALGIALLMVLLLAASTWWIATSLLAPIRALEAGARRVAAGDWSCRLAEGRADNDVGAMARAFNQMVAQLNEQHQRLADAGSHLERRNADLQAQIAERIKAEEKLTAAQTELWEASRRAGMADVASGVLHNVANVLNSVNVSVSMATNCVNQSQLPLLSRAAELVTSRQADLAEFLSRDERGKNMPRFLTAVARQLGEEQVKMLGELQSLARGVEHIKDIVTMQQSYARGGGTVQQMIDPKDLLADALNMSSASLDRHAVTVAHEYAEVPAIKSDKNRLLQILINLLRNAVRALDDAPSNERRITLRLFADQESRHVVLQVADTGAGITPECMARLFTHGFTTHKDGHGFGLNSSMKAARELGGTLTAASDGIGKGATFTLRVPWVHEKAQRQDAQEIGVQGK